MSVKYDLEGRIDRVKADLQLEIKEVRVEMKDLQLGIYRMIWIAAGAHDRGGDPAAVLLAARVIPIGDAVTGVVLFLEVCSPSFTSP